MNPDHRFMGRALVQAREALGRTAPNPSVGAVVVRDGQILGQGHTQPVGGPHAEVQAIADAEANGHDPRGATLYVTFEPCCHWGRTPPCSDLIIERGLARVVVGAVDPYPPMQGKGLTRLRAAGIEVTQGVREAEAAAVVRGFTRTITQGLPEVTAKAATSLDGHIATATGESKWITSDAARSDGHRLRSTHDAILVGIGTVIADDPRLNCRTEPGRDPVPVVFDTDLRIPLHAKLFTAGAAPVVICADDAPIRHLPADVIRVPRRPSGGIEPVAALRALAERGLHRVLVEGGGRVHRSLFDAGCVDTLHLYVAGLLIPGGRPWIGGDAVQRLAQGRRLPGPPEVQVLGPDLRLTWKDLFNPIGSDVRT